ncbi:ABC transporter ATP-binding protein [Rhodococcus sp. NCIMB 12038]|uniref:ABC transporter ATP-binding protein n=1 Tax=Rhodococcus sp. NCIMB 12038 TaxID=933800 RepID=UPI000B3C5795|nr:ATP-binding cassette domain-containing protein [Rhodococcus sp. NCIMB 12038]OUS92115.1 hypothetical protein CA951_29850 [Rhodococcus sp. NCIMB 12038]
MNTQSPLAAARGLTMDFGTVKACNGIDIDIDGSEIVGIVGPNGSGKSTLLKMLAGQLRPTSGDVHFCGQNVTKWKTDRRARAGLIMASQNQMVFGGVSVRDALSIGAACHAAPPPGTQRRVELADLIEMLHLSDVLDETVDELPLGYLRRVGIALAVSAQPQLLLLDEPAAGLNDEETEALRQLILQLRDGGLSVGIVDHDMNLMVTLCDRVVVLDLGRILAQGDPITVMNDQSVVDAYLGSPLALTAEEV